MRPDGPAARPVLHRRALGHADPAIFPPQQFYLFDWALGAGGFDPLGFDFSRDMVRVGGRLAATLNAYRGGDTARRTSFACTERPRGTDQAPATRYIN